MRDVSAMNTSEWNSKVRRRTRRARIFLIAASLVCLRASSAETTEMVYGPYCGICAVHAVARYYEKDSRIEEMLMPEYLSDSGGSSLLQIKEACKSVGLFGTPMERMSPGDLMEASCPAILHVRKNLEENRYGHYVVFFGMKEERFVILDPPGKPSFFTASELLAVWSGRGVVVSDRGYPAPTRSRTMLVRFVLAVGLGYVAAALVCSWNQGKYVNLLRSRRLTPCNCAYQIGVLLTVALIASLGFHALSPAGLLDATETIKDLERARLVAFVYTYDKEDVAARMAGPAVLVDARRAADYNHHHIDRAINIPPDTSVEQCRGILADMDKARELIVYCQSETCPYAGRVARLLHESGFSNLRIYKGGWNDWSKE